MSNNQPTSTAGEWVRGIGFASAALLGLFVWSGQVRITDLPAIGTRILDILLLCLLAAAVIAGSIVVGMVWSGRRKRSTARSVARVRTWWLGWFRYRRRWNTMMALHGLVITLNDRVLTPRLRSVLVGDTADTLTVRMVPGQAPTHWQQQGEALAHAFGAEAARIHVISPAVLGIDLRRVDALAEPIRLDTFRKTHLDEQDAA